MKKRILSVVFLLAALCLSASWGAGVIYASAVESAERESAKAEAAIEAYYEKSGRSVEVFDAAMSAYRTKDKMRSGEEIVTYGDDFGGVFIDKSGLLNIGVVINPFCDLVNNRL